VANHKVRFIKKLKILIAAIILLLGLALYYIVNTPPPGFVRNFPYGNKIGQININHGVNIFLPTKDNRTLYIHNFTYQIESSPLNLTDLNPNTIIPTPKVNKKPQGFPMEGKHIISGDLIYNHIFQLTYGGDFAVWNAAYWRGSSPLIVIIAPKNVDARLAIGTFELMSYKGLFYSNGIDGEAVTTPSGYKGNKFTLEIFNDPRFLDPNYYNKAVNSSEYCQKILGVYSVDDSKNYIHKSLGKWSCPNNYNEL